LKFIKNFNLEVHKLKKKLEIYNILQLQYIKINDKNVNKTIRYGKKYGVFPVTSNGKNATNFFPHLIFLKQENYLKSNKDVIIFIHFYTFVKLCMYK